MHDADLKENKMPEPTVSITPEPVINCSQLLEGFLSMYALQCKESAIEMNPRVLQAAIAMQDADEKRKRDSHISDVRTLTPAYILNTMQIGSSDLQALFPALSCTPLAKLDLTDCCIGDTGIRTLTELLSSSSRCGGVIRSIHLSGVGISDASPLGYFVTAAKQLQTLNISRNRIGTQPHGLAVLCAALRHHRSMRDVNFSDNLVSGSCNISMRSIAEWLVCAGHDDVLYSIDLRFNALGILKKVAGCIVRIPTVAKEGMGPIYGSHPLVDALMFNNTLESLELYGNGLSADVLDVIEAKLAVNRRAKAILRKSTHPPSTTIDCTK